MKLSESEARCVAKWERQERSWHWVRWVNVVPCVILIPLGAWNLHRLLDLTSDESGPAGAIAWFAPFVWLALLAPSAWLGYILGRWRGDMRTRLLLRLITEHEDEGN